jgi:hypothetical protein
MMNKQDILKKIGNIINELNEQHQYLSNTSKINILELELFTANADFLIDHIEILKKINHQAPEIAAVPSYPATEALSAEEFPVEKEEPNMISLIPEPEKTVDFEDVTEETIPEIKEEVKTPLFKFDFEEPTEMVFDFEKKVEVEDVFDRELTLDEQNLIEDKKKVLTREEEEQRIDLNIETDDLVEKVGEEPFIITKEAAVVEPVQEVKEEPVIQVFQQSHAIEQAPEPQKPEKVLSLNEILAGKSEQKIASASFKPISDLKSSISLNDKMIFIKELFNGYNLAYSEAIEILNRFDSFEAADNFLMKNYAEKNNWAQKQVTVDRLYEILNRKFKS